MPEQVREVHAKNVRFSYAEYWCDSCGDGRMMHTDVTVWNFGRPLQYEHRCTLCGAVADLPRRYPADEYNMEW